MAYITHGIIKCTPFLSVGHRDNTLFYGTISYVLIFLLNGCAFAFGVAIFCYVSVFLCFF